LGCGEPGATTVVPLRVHTLANCGLPPELSRENLELLALGDFAATNDSAEVLPLERRGAALKFPVATRAVEARVSNGVTAFAGYAERRQNAGVDVLLWPERATCVVWRPDGAQGYPGPHGGQALGYAAGSGVVLAAGGNDALVSDAIVGALSFDVATGELKSVDTSDDGVLREPRAFATVTQFGERLLVAGGEHPVFGVPEADIEPHATAEVFDPKLGRFSGEVIQLRSTRTRHAALTLDDGRTLLIGGRTRVGATSIAQYQLEIVDSKQNRASVADAIAARIEPRALRLTDGRIFVGGGIGLDGSLTQPVAQWLTADAQLDDTQASSDLAPRFDRAFVATAGGGVLAVGGCEDRPATSAEDAAACAACGHGCVPLDANFDTKYDAWWIDQDGAVTEVPLDGISAPRPILLPGSDGRPWLVAADAKAPEKPQLYRFNPWLDPPVFEPTTVASGARLPTPGMPEPLALGPDAFVWIDDSEGQGQLLGLRLGTRNRYTQDLSLVLAADQFAPEIPRHLVPDRALGDAVSYDGKLTLGNPNVTVLVADADYADVTIKLQLRGGDLPVVLLGTTPLGGAECPWPDGEQIGGEADLPTILRHGAQAQLRFHGGAQACAVAPGRLQLAVRAGDGVTTIAELDVERGVRLP
jgi:hypothetical protein